MSAVPLIQRVYTFNDLKDRGIVANYPQLRNLQRDHGFPLGRWLSPNKHVWTDLEIHEWLESRPIAVDRKPVKITERHISKQGPRPKKAVAEEAVA